MQTVHPLRESLHHEVHARPYERMNAPLLLSHVALVGNAGDAERQHVAALLRSSATPMSCPAGWPANDPRQCTGGRGQTSFFGAGMVNAAGAASR